MILLLILLLHKSRSNYAHCHYSLKLNELDRDRQPPSVSITIPPQTPSTAQNRSISSSIYLSAYLTIIYKVIFCCHNNLPLPFTSALVIHCQIECIIMSSAHLLLDLISSASTNIINHRPPKLISTTEQEE